MAIPFYKDVDHEDFEEELRRLWVKAELKALRREFYTALAIASVAVLGLAILGAWILLRIIQVK